MDFVEVDGLRIAYTRLGKGPPVFLLHGYVGDGRAAWRYQIDGLSDHFTVVAWDAPGVGGSSDPPESFGMAGYADCLARFIGSVGYDRVHIVGISFGGALALELCRRHPDVLASLVLASAYAGWGGSLPTDVAEARLQQAFSLAELSPDQFVDTLLPTMFAEGTPSESVEEFGKSTRGPSIRPASARWRWHARKICGMHCPPTRSDATRLRRSGHSRAGLCRGRTPSGHRGFHPSRCRRRHR